MPYTTTSTSRPEVLVPHAAAEAASPTRIQESLLSHVERRVLIWVAHRMPRRIHSDHLTLLALVAMVGAGASYWLASVSPLGLALVIVFLALNWFGDSLDGTLARVRQQQRPRFGYYVDHVVDALGILALFGGLALSGYMQPAIAAALLIAYLLVCLEVYLAAHSVGRFEMTFFGMGPTELRLVLASGNVALFINPGAAVLGGALSLFDVGGIAGAAGLFLTFLYSAARNTRRLYIEEPMPGRFQ
jgi:phosphatidylglycerophosphate synthase